jgi:small subunit ribosomal protein S18
MALFGAKKPPFKRKPKRAKKLDTPKGCRFAREAVFEIDYRDLPTLTRHVSSQGKLSSRKRSGVSAYYQRQMSNAVKRARFLALLPYVGE